MVDHDALFKTLLSTFFADFLKLFAPELAAAIELDGLEPIDKELFTDVAGGERKVLDLLMRVRRLTADGATTNVLVHVENQASSASGFAQRMFRYFAALTLRFGDQSVYPIAVFSYERPRRAEKPSWELRLPGLDVLSFRFRVVQLNRLDWRLFLETPNPVAAALMARMRFARRDRPRVKAACLRMLVGLKLDAARQALISGFVDSYLRLDAREETIFREEIASVPEQEKIMELTTSWMEKGIEQGREEGLEGQRRMLRVFVVRHLGPIVPALEERLAKLDAAALERLSETLLDMRTASDLEAWLDRQ